MAKPKRSFTVTHACTHKRRYVAAPTQMYIQMFGEIQAYEMAIKELTEEYSKKNCTKCSKII